MLQRTVGNAATRRLIQNSAPSEQPVVQRQMYRVEPGSVDLGSMGMVRARGEGFSQATSNSSGNYFLSGKGPGALPLALMGTKRAIPAYLNSNAAAQIINQVDTYEDDPYIDLPDVKDFRITISPMPDLAPRGENDTILNPVGDAANQIASGVAGVGLAGTVSSLPGNIGGAASDSYGQYRAVTGGNRTRQPRSRRQGVRNQIFSDLPFIGGLFGGGSSSHASAPHRGPRSGLDGRPAGPAPVRKYLVKIEAGMGSGQLPGPNLAFSQLATYLGTKLS